MAVDEAPKFTLPEGFPTVSRNEFIIAGIRVFIYGLSLIELDRDKVGVLFLMNQRLGSAKRIEPIAQYLCWNYYKGKKDIKLIVVTFDARNHGERIVDREANIGWVGEAGLPGNLRHGQDLYSIIVGTGDDVSIVATFLPSYIPNLKIVSYLASGVSMGGHVAWYLVSKDDRFRAAAPIIGCPDLDAMLRQRLGIDCMGDDRSKYSKDQADRWPLTLATIMSMSTRATHSISNKKLLILCGGLDTLVPAKLSENWVVQADKSNNIDIYVQDNAAHTCTKEMIDHIVDWLPDAVKY